MNKIYSDVARPKTRFTYKQFCLMVWQMTAKEDYHYTDYCRFFEKELKTLYLKTA